MVYIIYALPYEYYMMYILWLYGYLNLFLFGGGLY